MGTLVECANHNCKNKSTFTIGSNGQIRLICFSCYEVLKKDRTLDLKPMKRQEVIKIEQMRKQKAEDLRLV